MLGPAAIIAPEVSVPPYWICVMKRWADTGSTPPANGVMVSATALPVGLRTVSIELGADVVNREIPTI